MTDCQKCSAIGMHACHCVGPHDILVDPMRQTWALREPPTEPVALGRYLYETQENRCVPAWDQLDGAGATQSVWIERAQARLFEDLA